MRLGAQPLLAVVIIVSMAVLLNIAATKPIEGSSTIGEINAVAVRYVPDEFGMELRPSAFVVGLRIVNNQGADAVEGAVAASQFAEAVENAKRVASKALSGAVDFQQTTVKLLLPNNVLVVDGDSIGAAVALLLIAEAQGLELSCKIAVTGALDVNGRILPVASIAEKITAARDAGLDAIIIPEENYSEAVVVDGIGVIPARTVQEALRIIESLSCGG